MLEIDARDVDGEFLATPVKWDGPGEPPRIFVAPAKGKEAGPALGIGDRLLARTAQDALQLGFGGTPGYLIGPIRIAGGVGQRQFAKAIERARAAA